MKTAMVLRAAAKRMEDGLDGSIKSALYSLGDPQEEFDLVFKKWSVRQGDRAEHAYQLSFDEKILFLLFIACAEEYGYATPRERNILKGTFLLAAEMVDNGHPSNHQFLVAFYAAADAFGLSVKMRDAGIALLLKYYSAEPAKNSRNEVQSMADQKKEVKVLAFCMLASIVESM